MIYYMVMNPIQQRLADRLWLRDYQRKQLPELRLRHFDISRFRNQVTLISYTFPENADDFDFIEFAVRQSWACLGRLRTILVADRMTPRLEQFQLANPDDVEVQVEPRLKIGSIDSMSEDCIRRLHTRFSTPYCLIVQDDGFPLSDRLDEFLGTYDYLGAPTIREIRSEKIVDALHLAPLNGGFSLRSHRLCRAVARQWSFWRYLLPRTSRARIEDVFYTQTACLNPFFALRYRFAPSSVARSFSTPDFDGIVTLRDLKRVPFGSHGASALRQLLDTHRDPPIHVAMASDERYFEGLLTATWSMARFCSRPHTLVFHILNGGISQQNLTTLSKTLSPFGCRLDIITIDPTRTFLNFKAYHGGTMTYARLLLPDLLPHVDQIIYTDVDVLWLGDSAELWDSLSSEALLHVVPGCENEPKEEVDWFKSHQFPYQEGRRFCAGMIAMNLKKFRRERLQEKMLESLRAENGNIPYNDETLLNAYAYGRNDIRDLAPEWQLTSGHCRTLSQEPAIIHFIDDAPWRSLHSTHHLLTNPILLWHRIHANLRGISTWRSLRNTNSSTSVILCRTLFLAATIFPPVRAALYLYLTLIGKRDGIACLRKFLVPYKLPQSVYEKALSR